MTQAQIYIYGIDLGKNWFHLVAMDRMGHVLTKQKLTRSQLKQFISTTPPCRIAFEACPGSQYWGRLFQQAGSTPRLFLPNLLSPISNRTRMTSTMPPPLPRLVAEALCAVSR